MASVVRRDRRAGTADEFRAAWREVYAGPEGQVLPDDEKEIESWLRAVRRGALMGWPDGSIFEELT